MARIVVKFIAHTLVSISQLADGMRLCRITKLWSFL